MAVGLFGKRVGQVEANQMREEHAVRLERKINDLKKMKIGAVAKVRSEKMEEYRDAVLMQKNKYCATFRIGNLLESFTWAELAITNGENKNDN